MTDTTEYQLAIMDDDGHGSAISSIPLTGRDAQRANEVTQVGNHECCGRENCTVRPSWRVILGTSNVQVYTCQRHLPWAVELDMLTETRKRELHFADVPVINYTRTIHPVQVIPEMPVIRRIDFTRDGNIGATYPVYRDYVSSRDGYVFACPDWSGKDDGTVRISNF